jgi:integrase/recombinase XerD
MTDQAISPLRRRMIEDMTIRKLASKTQHDYVQRVKNFAEFLGRSPATACEEDVRSYQLHLASSGAHTPKINSTVSALRFFFDVTLNRADLAKQASFVHEPRITVEAPPGELGEEAFDSVEPRRRGRREVEGPARMPRQPLAHLGMLVRWRGSPCA